MFCTPRQGELPAFSDCTRQGRRSILGKRGCCNDSITSLDDIHSTAYQAARLVGLVHAELLSQSCQAVVLENILLLPWVADPNVSNVLRRVVSYAFAEAIDDLVLALWEVFGKDGQVPTLASSLFLVVHNKNGETGGRKVGTFLRREIGDGVLDILEKFRVGVLERGPRVVHLVDDQHILAQQTAGILALFDLSGTLVAADSLGIKPLCAHHLVTDLSFRGARNLFVQAQADGLNRDVTQLAGVERRGLLEEGSQYTSRVESTTANGDHEIGVELGLDPACRLADLDMDFLIRGAEVVVWELFVRHVDDVDVRYVCNARSLSLVGWVRKEVESDGGLDVVYELRNQQATFFSLLVVARERAVIRNRALKLGQNFQNSWSLHDVQQRPQRTADDAVSSRSRLQLPDSAILKSQRKIRIKMKINSKTL